MSNLSPENSTRSSVTKVLPGVGLQAARCFAIVDLGKHEQVFNGKPILDKKSGKQLAPSVRIMVLFELTKYMTTYTEEQGAVPYVVQQQYTFSAGQKAKLPDVLKSWGAMSKRPEKIDLRPFVGKTALISIEHSEDGKHANIGSKGRAISPWQKEFPITKAHYFYTPPKEKGQPSQQNGIFFTLDKFDPVVFEQLPPFTKKNISESIEWPSILAKYPQCAIKPKEQSVESEMTETSYNQEELPSQDVIDDDMLF